MPQLHAIRLGLPVTATADEMVDRAHALGDQVKVLESERDEWKKRANEFQARCIENDATVARLKKDEGEALIQAAVDAQKIHENEKEDLLAIYNLGADGAARVKAIIAKKEFTNFDNRTRALRDVEVRPDLLMELSHIVSQKVANNKNMTRAEAARIAYAEDPTLFGRIQAHKDAMRAKAGAGGGAK